MGISDCGLVGATTPRSSHPVWVRTPQRDPPGLIRSSSVESGFASDIQGKRCDRSCLFRSPWQTVNPQSADPEAHRYLLPPAGRASYAAATRTRRSVEYDLMPVSSYTFTEGQLGTINRSTISPHRGSTPPLDSGRLGVENHAGRNRDEKLNHGGKYRLGPLLAKCLYKRRLPNIRTH